MWVWGHQHTDWKSSASLRGVSLNSQDIFEPAGRSVAKSLFTFAFHPPPTARGAYVPTRSQTQQSIWEKAPAKGQRRKHASEMKQGAWCTTVDVWGYMRGFSRCKDGGRKLEGVTGEGEGRLVCTELCEASLVACLSPCVCVWMCVWMCVWCLVYYSFQKQPQSQNQHSGEDWVEKGGILKLIYPVSVRVHHSTQGPSCPRWHTHTNTHSDTHSIAFLSSVSNETPTDLYDTNDNTQLSLLCDTVRP